MTTDHDLLVRIDTQINYSALELIYWNRKEGNTAREIATMIKANLSAWKALRAVVELKAPDWAKGGINLAQIEGYNQALADMKQAIEKELG